MGAPGRVDTPFARAWRDRVNLQLDVFAGERLMAQIGHDPLDDTWTLSYANDWKGDPDAYPLSPALPLKEPERGYDARSIKRFIEHLLPEGHALDVAVAANGLTKSNVYGLIRALGTETLDPYSQTRPRQPQAATACRQRALLHDARTKHRLAGGGSSTAANAPTRARRRPFRSHLTRTGRAHVGRTAAYGRRLPGLRSAHQLQVRAQSGQWA